MHTCGCTEEAEDKAVWPDRARCGCPGTLPWVPAARPSGPRRYTGPALWRGWSRTHHPVPPPTVCSADETGEESGGHEWDPPGWVYGEARHDLGQDKIWKGGMGRLAKTRKPGDSGPLPREPRAGDSRP